MNVLKLSALFLNLEFFIVAEELAPDRRGPMRIEMYPGKPWPLGADDAARLRVRLDALAAADDARAAASVGPAGGPSTLLDPKTGEPLAAPRDKAE